MVHPVHKLEALEHFFEFVVDLRQGLTMEIPHLRQALADGMVVRLESFDPVARAGWLAPFELEERSADHRFPRQEILLEYLVDPLEFQAVVVNHVLPL